MSNNGFDPRAFRDALGNFGTGVAVITTVDQDGTWAGLTSNSFNSVSLEPPLVLWSLAKTSTNYDSFISADYFSVNILSSNQVELSNRFAQKGGDKFSGLDCDIGLGGVPLLKGCVARFECKKIQQHEGGDHLIFIGEVEQFSQQDQQPLAFLRGKYAVMEQHPELV